MPIRRKRGFFWIPPDRNTIWTVTIDGVDITDFILAGSFPDGLISEELISEIELDNSGEDFTDRFKIGHIIVFKMDFSDGSTVQYEGPIEELKNSLEGGFFKIKIKGAHYSAEALDVMVTQEFSGALISDIRTTLISTYLTGFTSTNVETNVDTIDIKFVNKPLLDCLIELDIQGDEDTYVDSDKGFHTFKRGSKNNEDEAFVWDDSLITLRGLGQDSADVRNRVNVYGEVGGLPVIYRSDDTTSQTTYGVKEKIITDTSIKDEDEAKEFGDSTNLQEKDPDFQGSATALFMPSLIPGYMTYVIFPPNKVHARFRVVKFVYKVPGETTEAFFNKERSIPKLFKDRILKSLGQETVVNPFNMTRSFLFTFNDESKTDSAASSGIVFEDGIIRKETGIETGINISIAKESDITANFMELRVKGEIIDGATYEFKADSQAEWQSISPNGTTETSIVSPGVNIQLRINITSVNTRIDTAGLYWKN